MSTDFPIENLPLGVLRGGRICTAIGDRVLDLHACAELKLVGPEWLASNLNGVAPHVRELRATLQATIEIFEPAFRPMGECEFRLPVDIGDYTDFYASIEHATNVGKLFRPDSPLLPNYRHVPIAYHGRASSVVVSGTPVKRPWGQLREGVFGATECLDYEMEVGMIVGVGNGEPISVNAAEGHILGFCIVNDWSARDIQRWEYQPLGPFLSKSFATTMSPWIVTKEALEPYRSAAPLHDTLPYLETRGGSYDITVEVSLNGQRLARSNSKDLYWSFTQMIAHHTSNGCNLRPGDLIASGTLANGCLLELGRDYLKDGDEVVMTAYAEKPGLPRIGFGECRGTVTSGPSRL